MGRQKSPKNSDQRKRRALILFVAAGILALAFAALSVLSDLKPPWLPVLPWPTVTAVLGALTLAITVWGALYSNIFLRLTERRDAPRPPSAKELRDESPLLRVTCESLIKGLGNGGEIPWIERGIASLSLLYQHERIAVIGPMKSGKTREALELIRIAQQNGLVLQVFQPAAAINVIDLELLASAVAVQLDQPCLFFIDDIGVLQDEAYLERLSICIDTIARVRPDARFVITLQEERLRLSEALQAWVDKHRFHRVSPPDLTAEQRHELAESGTKTLGASLTLEAVAVLGNDTEIVRPWDIVWVLQAALDRKADKLPLTEPDVEALVAEGEQAVWARQRQSIIKIEPAAEQLLESIGTFFSAGVTPRESSILRYAAFRMRNIMRPGQQRLHLRLAACHLEQYAIVAFESLYAIPEPRLLPLIIDTGRARQQLNAFIAAYSPGFWTLLSVRALRPFDLVEKHSLLIRLRQLPLLSHLSKRLYGIRLLRGSWISLMRVLESVYAWPAARALLAAELGATGSGPSYLSSAVIRERGCLALRSGSLRTALDQFDTAIALNPTNARALAMRGVTYHRMGQFDDAMDDFDRAVALDSKNALTIANRGETYRLMGKYELALTDFDRAIGLDEKYAWAIASRGETYRLMGKYELALTDFDRAIGLDGTDAWAIASRGTTYVLIGKYELALADLDRAIAVKPGDLYHYQRALLYLDLGQAAAAVADFTAAIDGARETEAKSPDDWWNKLYLALYYLASGDRAAAEGRYQAAIDAGVNEGQVRNAILDLNDYLHLFPADEVAREMRERLQRYVESRFANTDKRS